MTVDTTRAALDSGSHLYGMFWPEGSDKTTAGTLQWSNDDGAEVELIAWDGSDGWPSAIDSEPFDVLGSRRDGTLVSLRAARIRSTSLWDGLQCFRSSSVALGAHVNWAQPWTCAVYETANLFGWRNLDGLAFSFGKDQPNRLEWEPLKPDTVTLADGTSLSFESRMPTGALTRPQRQWSIEQRQVLRVTPPRPMTVDELRRRYAQPLRALIITSGDRPDELVSENIGDVGDPRSWFEVRNYGTTLVERKSGPGSRFLTRADTLPSFEYAIKTWWELYETTFPALGLFASHVNDGNVYSPARFLTLFTAAETYARERHRNENISALASYADVPPAVTGCTRDALSLIGATRKYLAHGAHKSRKYSHAYIEDHVFESTRRLHALMQACLLRDLGLDSSAIAERLTDHYRAWPVP